MEASQQKLKTEQAQMEQELVARQKKVSMYENEMNTHIMQLNNDIGHKKQEQEQIMLKLTKLKADEQDSSLTQLKKIKKLSRVYIKLSDFGLAKVGVFKSNLTKTMLGGGLTYKIPEVVMQKPYGQSVDLYLYGLLMYEMLLGVPAFPCPESEEE